MSDEELKQLVESNARAIQTMLDARAEDRLKFQAFQQRMEASALGFQAVTARLANVQKDIDRLLERRDRAADA